MFRSALLKEGKLNGLASTITPRTIAIWGSAGSGKTMVAINLAFELTRLNAKVLLIDLDLRRPSISSWLGITDGGPGITATMRLARANRLNVDEVLRLSAELRFGSSKLDILTGLSSPLRWQEVLTEDLKQLLATAAEHFDLILFDLNDETGESVGLDLGSESQAQITRWLIESADVVLATFVADPVGVNRFLFDLSSIDREIWPIANRVSTRNLGKAASKELQEILAQFTRFPIRAQLPIDWASCDSSIANARPLLLESPNAKLTLAIRSLASEIFDECASGLNSEGGKN